MEANLSIGDFSRMTFVSVKALRRGRSRRRSAGCAISGSRTSARSCTRPMSALATRRSPLTWDGWRIISRRRGVPAAQVVEATDKLCQTARVKPDA
jgi:hypothetical protein